MITMAKVEILSIFVYYLLMKIDVTDSFLYITKLVVPERVDPRRDSAILSCYYTLGSERLFSVKWHKEDEEFFRFMPSYHPQVMTFDVEGVIPFMPASSNFSDDFDDCGHSSCTIRLIHLTPSSAGVYSCEVSTEAPSFIMDVQTKSLSIVAAPGNDPSIEGISNEYSIGDTITASCTSDWSYPPTQIIWYINNIAAPKEAVYNVPGTFDEFYLAASSSNLRINVKKEHFLGTDAVMNIKCEALIPGTDITGIVEQNVHRLDTNVDNNIIKENLLMQNNADSWLFNRGAVRLSSSDTFIGVQLTSWTLCIIFLELLSIQTQYQD